MWLIAQSTLPSRMRTRNTRDTHGTGLRCLLLSLLLLVFPNPCTSYIYVQNATYGSLPALFGRFLLDGKIYQARLQYFPDNPYLCDLDEGTKQKFIPPSGPTIPDAQGNNLTLAEPVILLVGRGNCPFQRKAAMAEAIHDSIRFLLVYNFGTDGTQDELLVPMYSQFGNTHLVLLSISHATGQALKLFLSKQPQNVTAMGGPLIQFDSEPPMGLLTAADIQSMMLSALGLFFMLISFTGCLVILAGTYNQIALQQEGDSFAPARRRLLTADEVHRLTAATPQVLSSATTDDDLEASPFQTGATVATRARSNIANHSGATISEESSLAEDEEHQCAVCLDGFESDTEITALPCHHLFHTDCILPWLTERQSKCPLCKFDVLQYIRENGNAMDPCSDDVIVSASTASWWDRIRRYRWTSVLVVGHLNEQLHHDQDGNAISDLVDSSHGRDFRFQEEDLSSGVELTPPRRHS